MTRPPGITFQEALVRLSLRGALKQTSAEVRAAWRAVYRQMRLDAHWHNEAARQLSTFRNP